MFDSVTKRLAQLEQLGFYSGLSAGFAIATTMAFALVAVVSYVH